MLGEGVAEDVEDLALIRRALLLDLVEEALEDLALARVRGEKVPQVADLSLADAVDASEALFDAVGVPGQVVVHHEMGALQVETLAGRVRRDQDSGLLVLREDRLDLAAILSPDAAVNGDDRFVPADHHAGLVDQVVQGVAVLSEDDDLAWVACLVDGERLIREDGAQLGPLAVRAGEPHAPGEFGEVVEDLDLGLELCHRLRRGGGINDVLL